MMKNKLLALFICVAMILGVLVGCGSSNSTTDTPENNTDAPPAETTNDTSEELGDDNSTAKGKVTLSVWNEPHPDEELNMYAQCEKATGIELEVTVIPESEYSSKLNQMVATNDNSIDIYIVWENDIVNFAQVGGIIPLDDYLENSDIKTDDFIDAVAQLSEGLGGTYGLPWCVATEILYYNKDMFDEVGIEYPDNDWAYEDFKKAVEKLTKKADDGTTEVYGCTLPDTQTWWAGIGGAGDPIYDPATGEMIIGDGAVEFITDCLEMVEKGYMPAPSSDTTDLFAAGKAAMSWQGSWFIGAYGDELDFNWDIASIPTNKIKYNTLHTGFYTINANSDNKDAAFKVIEYLMGEEGQAINSKASGNPSAIRSIADKGAWKVESATTIENWEAITDSLEAGVFGYVCLPSGVTNNAISEFESALLGHKTPQEAVESALQYAKETIGY